MKGTEEGERGEGKETETERQTRGEEKTDSPR